jgi:glycosyltransferase involved in cell wall biosynthesis/organic radical activating enzyme
MSDPLVTVIILLYNDLPHSHRAIQSVLLQSFKDLKIKIMDNGSTDNTWSEIQKYASDPRVSLIRNVQNRRSEFAAYEALKTDTEYLSFLFADDVYLPERIEIGLKTFRDRPDLDAVFSNVKGIDEHDQPVHGKPWSVFDGDISLMSQFDHLRHFVFYGNCLHPCAMLVKTKTYIEQGGFKPYFHHIGDMIFFTRLLTYGKAKFLKDKLQQVTVWSNGRNESFKNAGGSLLLAHERVMFLEEYLSPAMMEQYINIFEGENQQDIVLKSQAERLWYIGHKVLSGDNSIEARLFACRCFYKAAEIGDAEFYQKVAMVTGRTVPQYLAALGSDTKNVGGVSVSHRRNFKGMAKRAIKAIPLAVPVYRYLKRELRKRVQPTENFGILPDALPKGRDMELITQGNEGLFKNKTILFHFEFTEVCNQHCSYCIEGNGNLNKPKPHFSKEEDMLGTLDKIFQAFEENVRLGFILVGGEPTLQPCFKKVVDKIKSRKNTFQILTTNFSQSAAYYRELDIPLVTSLHFESQDLDAWLDKTMQLSDLIAHTRIMAHPRKMDLVKNAYRLFSEAAKEYPLSFAVEEIVAYGNYKPNYNKQDLEYIKNTKPVDCVYPQSLQEKLGVLSDLFYRFIWTYKDENGNIVKKNDGTDNFRNFYCERNMLVIHADGKLRIGWHCDELDINMYKIQNLPRNLIKTVVCNKEKCPVSFAAQFPKYKSMEYAPDYINVSDLISLK